MDEPEPDGRRRTVSGGPLDGKPFAVTGYEVWQAWEQVRDNKGAPGVDGQSIAAFEERLEDNLYRVWNRMSSGAWFPPPVKAVEIPKAGGTRTLGVSTTADRVAQTVAANRIGTVTEKFFHADSFGYRPGRGAHDVLAVARKRCDGLIHCKTQARARQVLAALKQRMSDVGLELHPGKTQVFSGGRRRPKPHGHRNGRVFHQLPTAMTSTRHLLI